MHILKVKPDRNVWIFVFRRKFVDLILDGEKTVEIRWEGTVNIDKVRPGDYVLLISKVKEGVLGVAKVRDVVVKSIRDFTDVDALNAGFSNKDELIRELMQIYPIKSFNEKYYLISLIPLLDLRSRPIKLEKLNIKLTYWDLRGKIVNVGIEVLHKILQEIRQ